MSYTGHNVLPNALLTQCATEDRVPTARQRHLCRTKMLKRCRVATAFSHDSVLNAAANGQLSQQDGAQLIAGLCGLYGMDVPTNCVTLESEGSMFPEALMLANKGGF